MSVTAIVLAGRRGGRLDPLAEEFGESLKCLVPIEGTPLIGHVVRALVAAPSIGEIVVVGSEQSRIMACLEPVVRDGGKTLRIVEAADNLVDSVLRGSEGTRFPLLITTADNVLLTPETVEEFLARIGETPSLSAAVAMTTRERVLAAHPTGQRRFYEFADGAFSNCNLYWLGHERALSATETFREGGQFVKFPMRIVKAFGIANLVRFHFGIGTTRRFFGSVSRRLNTQIAMIELSDGACAIDVDNARSYEVAQQIMRQRAPSSLAA